MKKFLAVLICILFFGSSSFAQKRFVEDFKPSGELKLGLSLFTTQEIALKDGTAFTVGIPSVISADGSEPNRDVRSPGTYFLGGSGYLSEHWSIGLLLFYGEYEVNTSYSNGNVFSYTNRYFGGMARTDFRWLSSALWQLYSGAGIGITAVQSQSFDGDYADQTTFATEVTAIGVRYGDVLGIFAELGYGNLGILAVGINYKF